MTREIFNGIGINYSSFTSIHCMYHPILLSIDRYVVHFYHAHKAVIILLAIGMVAGLLAQLILPVRGFGMIGTILIGCAGAWLGNKYIRAQLTLISDPLIKTVAAATIGAMALAIVINAIRGGRDRDKSSWRHG